MAICLGIDTGGTYTDAVILDDETGDILGTAKALTTRPDLAEGVGAAIDAVLAKVDVKAQSIGMVSLSTTLATNALVEGQGGRVALVLIGFDSKELARAGLAEAIDRDPVIFLSGGHDHAGSEIAPLDLGALDAALRDLPAGITAFAIAGRFATRNPKHEEAAAARVRDRLGLPVTTSQGLSAALGGPKRALTALLNARLIGLIARLIDAAEAHLVRADIAAPLMVVRGDGALISAEMARKKPIETILSGPAASAAGAAWLSGQSDALVSDIGGTTTDICLLKDGRPRIDPNGAKVGPHRTMVEAVAMRTWGLGGDSEVSLLEGLNGGLVLGPRRILPVSLLACRSPDLVRKTFDLALQKEAAPAEAGRFVVPLWTCPPEGLDPREARIVERLVDGPIRRGDAVQTRLEGPALDRLVKRGFVIEAGVTPSDAAHVLGLVDAWDREAAQCALSLFARRRQGDGSQIAPDGDALAARIIETLHAQTQTCLIETAFAEDSHDWPDPAEMALHPLVSAGLGGHQGLVKTQFALGLPVIGLGASARSYYPPLETRLHSSVIVPNNADVANAIGAVVGQVTTQATGSITSPGPGHFVAHLNTGPQNFSVLENAIDTLRQNLKETVCSDIRASGVEEFSLSQSENRKRAVIEGQEVVIEVVLKLTAAGRPRIALS